MRILALVASPRRLGNSEILAKEMLASLPDEIEKEMIRLTDLAIGPCRACYACLPAGKDCVLEDDLDFLLDRIRAADGVVIVSPCYFLGSHTTVKTIGDRLISVLADQAGFSGKRCVTATVYGIPDWEGYAREAVRNFARFLHLEVVGSMAVQAANPGEAVCPEVLAQAAELAQRLIGAASPREEAAGAILCKGCASSLLQVARSGEVHCVMCGAKGRLSQDGGEISAAFAAEEAGRFSPEGMEEHARRLAQVKEEYLANRGELFKIRKPYENYDWWVKPR